MKIKKIIRLPRLLIWAFVMEGKEAKNMLQTFAARGKELLTFSTTPDGPAKEDLENARKQLKDLTKLLPFLVLIVVPLPGVTESYVLLALTLEKWLGHKVSLLPAHIRAIFQSEKSFAEKRSETRLPA